MDDVEFVNKYPLTFHHIHGRVYDQPSMEDKRYGTM
jgi:hypothetical protein